VRAVVAMAPPLGLRALRRRPPRAVQQSPGDLTKSVYRLLLARDALAPMDTLRLRSLAIMTILTWKMLRCGSVMRSNGMLVSSS
jgi:hypothetical protein